MAARCFSYGGLSVLRQDARMLAPRCLARRGKRWAPREPRRTKFTYGPKFHRGPLPRTPWTVSGPPPGVPLPWYLQKVPSVREQLPELDVVTYEGKLHYVPWLAKPNFPKWERGWHDPRQMRAPRPEELPAYKQRPCYLCFKRTRLLEGVKQALWLTKTKLIEGLPPQILSIMNDTACQLEDQDERVQNAIHHAYFWVNTDAAVAEETYSPVLLEDLLHLCRSMTTKYPSLAKRMMAQDCKVSASWERESVLLQVRGPGGKLVNAKTPLPPIASKDEVLATENHILETFHPISPMIDLQEVNVYETKNDTGFQEGYPYPYVHTIYFPGSGKIPRMLPEQLRANMMMFAFGSALAKAKRLYGDEPMVLEKPIVVQSIGSDGLCFQFMIFQLNTTDLNPSIGVKNLVWIDADQFLYEDYLTEPETKHKVVVVPAGVYNYHPDTFKKFLAFYLHGVV